MLDQAVDTNASIVRTLVTWSIIAPTRPANAANPFDKAYRFDDLDELVRNAQDRDLEVLITIWGTPKWANGGKTPNFAPTRMSDLTAFSRAVASRYSGRYAGFPFVRFYSIWNESNLQLFLAPQFDAKGKSVGPRIYSRIAAAAYAGIKAGNSAAKVAVGSTSSAGRDKPLAGKSATHSPGPVRAARRRGEPAPEVRRVGAAPVSGPGEPEAEPARQVAERDAVVVSALREVARHLVQAQERPHLDHRVRPRGEAGRRAERRLARAPGDLHEPRARAREGRHADGHVHLVHLPRPRDEHVAERPPHEDRRCEALAREVPRGGRARRTPATRS